jgi:hypothetical protein
MNRWLLLPFLAACSTTDSADPADTAGVVGSDDSGADSADTGGHETCDVHLSETDPADGATGVYYHAPITLTFSGDASAALVEVRDPQGVAAPATASWGAGNLILTLQAELQPDTAYTIHVESCGVTQETHFTTSVIGGLSITPAELVNRTFSFTLADADITEPAVLEALDDTTLVMPLGFMVQSADDTQIDILGALLDHKDGTFVQKSESATWDFPTADFRAAPYFELRMDTFSLLYSVDGGSETEIVFYDFFFSGAFDSTGNDIVQGTIDTEVDTRDLGPLFGLDDTEDAVCDLARQFAVNCVACPDGADYCLHTVGQDITAPLVEGLVLTPYP